MATYTTIADLQIVPDKFSEYTIERTTQKSTLVRSGITTADPKTAQLINGTPRGGNTIQMPFYKPLDGEDDVFSEEAVSVGKVATGIEMATLLIRQKAWGDTDLSKVFGGTDPLGAIAELVSDWWVIREQAMMLSILKGIMDPDSGALKSHVLDISADPSANKICVDATLDAKNLMGDAANKLGVVFMHSATYTYLQKQQKIQTEYSSDLKIKIDYYLGYEVIVDDGMPVDKSGTTKYTTYFVGKGAFARDDGMPDGLVGYETDRDKMTATNYLINRRALVLHPHGLSWKKPIMTGKYAANADLAKPASWEMVKDHKNIPIVSLVHQIG